jgi:hypothetical protein
MATSSLGRRREICQRRKDQMEIYNKGLRDIIIAREDFLSGNVLIADDPTGKQYAHITPEMICDIKDDVAIMLIAKYPSEIVKWGKSTKER